MKLPAKGSSLSLCLDQDEAPAFYPPLGFVPVAEAQLGNGDSFGLYWPFGGEDGPPIVCETLHDEWRLVIRFSDVPTFMKWLEANDYEWGEEEVPDPDLCTTRYQKAMRQVGGNPETAIEELGEVCHHFPEIATHWASLGQQRLRLGDREGALDAGVRSICSNWCFGRAPESALRSLRSVGDESRDPLAKRSADLTLRFGGKKENSDYRLIRESAFEYLQSPTPTLGLLLMHNYGLVMSQETTAFQERYEFDAHAWQEELLKACRQHLGSDRLTVQPVQVPQD